MAIKTKKVKVADEIYEHKDENKKMEIYREQHPVSPRSWDNYGVMVCSHKSYNLGDREPETERHSSWSGVKKEIRENNDVELILPIYAYQHSGITVSTTPFQSHFDSGQVGFIYVTKSRLDELGLDEEHRTQDRLRTILKGEVETYDQYLNNDVWKYRLLTNDEGEELLDSCGGFFGSDKESRQHIFETAGEEMDDYEKTGGEL